MADTRPAFNQDRASCTILIAVTDVVVSRAGLQELGELLPLVEGYRSFCKRAASDRTERYLRDRIVNDEAIVFIARQDGSPMAFTLIYPTFSTTALAPIWLLSDLFVTEQARGRGVASALMEEVERAAREAGAARIWLRTGHDNAAAQALYEGRGWVRNDVLRRYDLIL